MNICLHRSSLSGAQKSIQVSSQQQQQEDEEESHCMQVKRRTFPHCNQFSQWLQETKEGLIRFKIFTVSVASSEEGHDAYT